MSYQFLTPEGEWVSERVARRRLEKLAKRFEALEQRDRAAWVRRDWRRILGQPSVWKEQEGLAARWEDTGLKGFAR